MVKKTPKSLAGAEDGEPSAPAHSSHLPTNLHHSSHLPTSKLMINGPDPLLCPHNHSSAPLLHRCCRAEGAGHQSRRVGGSDHRERGGLSPPPRPGGRIPAQAEGSAPGDRPQGAHTPPSLPWTAPPRPRPAPGPRLAEGGGGLEGDCRQAMGRPRVEGPGLRGAQAEGSGAVRPRRRGPQG